MTSTEAHPDHGAAVVNPPHLVVVDVETTGLDYTRHTAVEVAWWNLTTGARGLFIPCHRWQDIAEAADPASLRVNGYITRELWRPDRHDTRHDGALALHDALSGAILAGSNPGFDLSFLPSVFAQARADEALVDPPELASHRLTDIGNVAAGALGLPFTPVPGLEEVCRRLGVTPGDHTAEGDVTAEGMCLNRLGDPAWVDEYLRALGGRDGLEWGDWAADDATAACQRQADALRAQDGQQ